MDSLVIVRLFYRESIVLPALALTAVAMSFPTGNVAQQRRPSPTAQAASNTTTAVGADLRRATDLLQLGKLDEAERILRHVLATSPGNADAHNLLGIVMDQRGKTTEAEREYQAAIRLNPNGVSAMANLGVLLARTNRSDEAIRTFESVLRAAPDHPQATLNLGLQNAARGNYAN